MTADFLPQNACSESGHRSPSLSSFFAAALSRTAYQLLWWPSRTTPKKIKDKLPFSPWGVILCLLKGVFHFFQGIAVLYVAYKILK